MTHDGDLDATVRGRIRELRRARGWTLDVLADRAQISASTLSRLETGGRRIALDQLAPIARALDITIDALIDTTAVDDVVIRAQKDHRNGATIWNLTGTRGPNGLSVMKMRLTPSKKRHDPQVHPGRDWFYVLSGTVRLVLGSREMLVEAGQAVEFETMTPHAIGAHLEPAEILTIFDHDGQRAHVLS